MRPLSIMSLLVVCASCTVPLPRPPGLAVSVPVRAKVQATAQVDVQVDVPPPAPTEPVPIQGAEVVEFFGIPLEGAQDVVFVLDRSGSMSGEALGRLAEVQVPPDQAEGQVVIEAQAGEPAPPRPATKLEVAQAELVDALVRLPVGTRLNVVFFDDELSAVAGELVALDEPGRAGMIDFVRSMTPRGSTALAPAMRLALVMNASRVVLLSDGLGNVGGGEGAVLRDAREAIRGGVRIDTIGLGSDQAAPLLQTLADESGGIYQAL